MRLVVGIALIHHGIAGLRAEPQLGRVVLDVLATGAGLFLLAGLWTPVAGSVVAVIELWYAFSQPGDPLIRILLGTVGVALALVGPGKWSVDARLFGWKRINIPTGRVSPSDH